MKNKSKPLKLMVLTAMFAALTTVLTFFIKIPTATGGYVHLGDFIIYLAAVVLPTPYALMAGAIGGGLADLLGGYVHYLLPTMIIKALLTIPFTAKKEKMLTTRNALMTIPCAVITVAGYGITSVVMLSLDKATAATGFWGAFTSWTTWAAGFSASAIGDTGQAVCSAIAFFAAAFALDRINAKEKLLTGRV